jgi:hypothetical protein
MSGLFQSVDQITLGFEIVFNNQNAHGNLPSRNEWVRAGSSNGGEQAAATGAGARLCGQGRKAQ